MWRDIYTAAVVFIFVVVPLYTKAGSLVGKWLAYSRRRDTKPVPPPDGP